MNERINVLKHLASVWCDENIPELYSEETNGYGKAWEDKFAELIVAECVAQCEKNKDHEWLGSGSKLSAFNIREHFGVEE